MEHLISQYIDDELSLDEKIDFVRTVHGQDSFREEALALLGQEKLLRQTLEGGKAMESLSAAVPAPPRPALHFFTWLGWSGWAAAALLLFLLIRPAATGPSVADLVQVPSRPATLEHRFVIYKPGIKRAEISGSFTDWRKIPLRPAATSGYWEVTLGLKAGEHKFVYILDGKELFPDPTVPEQETDDFGERNSILLVGA